MRRSIFLIWREFLRNGIKVSPKNWQKTLRSWHLTKWYFLSYLRKVKNSSADFPMKTLSSLISSKIHKKSEESSGSSKTTFTLMMMSSRANSWAASGTQETLKKSWKIEKFSSTCSEKPLRRLSVTWSCRWKSSAPRKTTSMSSYLRTDCLVTLNCKGKRLKSWKDMRRCTKKGQPSRQLSLASHSMKNHAEISPQSSSNCWR